MESFLYPFILDNYEHALVSEASIQEIIGTLNAKQDEYFSTHRGKPVEISHAKMQFSNLEYISVGNISLSLTPVRIEL